MPAVTVEARADNYFLYLSANRGPSGRCILIRSILRTKKALDGSLGGIKGNGEVERGEGTTLAPPKSCLNTLLLSHKAD